jgi:Mg-chelatase subunit ChlD
MAVIFLINCSRSMSVSGLIEQAEQALNGLMTELHRRNAATAIAVITHSETSGRPLLDTILELGPLGTLEGPPIQGSQLHAEGIEVYEEALRYARRILVGDGGSIARRMIVMIGDGNVGREGDLEGICRDLRSDSIPAHSAELKTSSLKWSMARISGLTGGRRAMSYASPAAFLDAVL